MHSHFEGCMQSFKASCLPCRDSSVSVAAAGVGADFSLYTRRCWNGCAMSTLFSASLAYGQHNAVGHCARSLKGPLVFLAYCFLFFGGEIILQT